MTNKGKQIAELLKSNGKSAPEMTHALKFIGDGSMEKGLKRIGTYFEQEVKKGKLEGAVGGAAIMALAIGLGALVKKKIDEDKKHKEEGEAILKGLEQGLSEYTEENVKAVE